MPERTDWTSNENDVLVIASLDMLARELQGEPYLKTRVNEAVQRAIGRSKGSIEFKLANVYGCCARCTTRTSTGTSRG